VHGEKDHHGFSLGSQTPTTLGNTPSKGKRSKLKKFLKSFPETHWNVITISTSKKDKVLWGLRKLSNVLWL